MTSLLGPAVIGMVLAAPGASPSSFYGLSVRGDITIGTEGEVVALSLEEGLQPVVQDVVDRQVRSWRFHPIVEDGEAVVAGAKMWLSLSAEPDGDKAILRIASVSFGESANMRPPGRPPRYPYRALERGIGGIVDLRLLIGEGGEVVQAHVYRTSVSLADTPGNSAEGYRRQFAQAALRAARRWRFDGSVRPGATVGYCINFQLAGGSWQFVNWSDAVPAPWRATSDEMAEIVDYESRPVILSTRVRLIEDVRGRAI